MKTSRALRSAMVIAAAVALLWTGSPAAADNIQGGGVFVTGHDPDYHAVSGTNNIGSIHVIQKGIAYATGGISKPRVLLAGSANTISADHTDSRQAMTASGYSADLADYGSHTPGVYDLNTVDFRNWDVLVVASDNAGSLTQGELDVLNRRVRDIADYVTLGGGLVVFGEDLLNNRFKFLPCLTDDVPQGETELGFTVTQTGTDMGLTDLDVNGNVSTNIFARYGPFSPVDLNQSGQVVSIAAQNPCPHTARVAPPPRPATAQRPAPQRPAQPAPPRAAPPPHAAPPPAQPAAPPPAAPQLQPAPAPQPQAAAQPQPLAQPQAAPMPQTVVQAQVAPAPQGMPGVALADSAEEQAALGFSATRPTPPTVPIFLGAAAAAALAMSCWAATRPAHHTPQTAEV